MGRCAAIAIATIVLAAIFCQNRRPDRVTTVADDDPKMNAAMEKARSTVDAFIGALKTARPDRSDFAVKMAFSDGESTEVMWLSPVAYDGKVFRGPVSNEPRSVRTVRSGQIAEVAPSGIADWMYTENGRLVGAYTLRVLRDTLSPGERAAFDREVRFADE